MSDLRVAVLTVSDRSARGQREDRAGPAVSKAVEEMGWRVCERAVVADEAAAIRDAVASWCDAGGVDLVLTTGGTGFGPRDVTPEATRSVIDREAPGLAERMRREGEKSTPMAALSRGVCGIRGRVLVVNLPGSPRGARESFASVAELIPHGVETLRGEEVSHP